MNNPTEYETERKILINAIAYHEDEGNVEIVKELKQELAELDKTEQG